jgi:hypothetical protein
VDALIDAVSDDEIDELLDILSEEPSEEPAEEEVERWKNRFWLLLKWLYVALAMVAAAGALTVGDLEEVQVLLLVQLTFLDRFAQEVATGAVSRAEAGRRMRMYVNSARSSFWRTLDRKMLEAGYTEEIWDAIGDANTCSGTRSGTRTRALPVPRRTRWAGSRSAPLPSRGRGLCW